MLLPVLTLLMSSDPLHEERMRDLAEMEALLDAAPMQKDIVSTKSTRKLSPQNRSVRLFVPSLRWLSFAASL